MEKCWVLQKGLNQCNTVSTFRILPVVYYSLVEQMKCYKVFVRFGKNMMYLL